MEKLIQSVRLLCQYYIGSKDPAYFYEDSKFQQALEYEVMSIFTGFLEENGKEISQVKLNYKQLCRILHPDHLANANPELLVIESILSRGTNDGALFRLLGNCFAKLKDRNKPGQQLSSYADIQSIDDLLLRLQENKSKAETLTGRALIDSLYFLIEKARDFHQTTGTVDSTWLRGALRSLPYFTGGFCLSFFIEELALIYALTFLMTKGGFWMGSSKQADWQYLGVQVASYGLSLGSATTALVSRTMGFNFYLLTSIGSLSTQLYDQLTGAQSLQPQDLLGGEQFKTLELKLISYPLEEYCFQQSRQYFSTLRYGSTKRALIIEALQAILLVDKRDEALFAKLVSVRAILDELSKFPILVIPGSQSKRALDTALQIQIGLIEELPLPNPSLMITAQPLQIIEDYRAEDRLEASSSGASQR